MRFPSVFILCAALGGTALFESTSMAAPAQETRPLVSGERVRVNKITRDITSAMQQLEQGGSAPFQDPAYANKWHQSYQRYQQALSKYPQHNDPDVKAALAKLQDYARLIETAQQQAAGQTASLGDVQKRLKTIEDALRQYAAPQWLPAPFKEEDVRQWIMAAAAAQKAATMANEALTEIGRTAHLPVNPGTVQSGAPYDKQDVSRLMNMANRNLTAINEAIKKTEDTLNYQAQMQERELAFYRELDPDNASHRANYFLKEGAEADIYAGLDKQLALAQSFVDYQKGLNQTPNAFVTNRVAEIAQIRERYAGQRQQLLGASRLPEAKSTDTSRLAIARQILANPEYSFANHGPVVLTTGDIVEREEEVSREKLTDIDISLAGEITLSGTKTTWHYRWDEFKFATPIKDPQSNQWYIWWITAKKFYSGSAKTPIGQWVSGGATKGDLILRQNF